MLHLHLSSKQISRIMAALNKAGDREIGGVLVGENLGESQFRLMDLSIQISEGTESCFIRMPEEHVSFTRDFHNRTGQDYERFNYLGEWHSHPMFTVLPSGKDLETMQNIVDDVSEPATFAVLLVVRLDSQGALQVSGSVFMQNQSPERIQLLVEQRQLSKMRLHWNAVTSRLRRPFKRFLSINRN